MMTLEEAERRIAKLEAQVNSIPNTSLLNRNVLARSFTVLGHLLLANLILGAGYLVLYLFAYAVAATR